MLGAAVTLPFVTSDLHISLPLFNILQWQVLWFFCGTGFQWSGHPRTVLAFSSGWLFCKRSDAWDHASLYLDICDLCQRFQLCTGHLLASPAVWSDAGIVWPYFLLPMTCQSECVYCGLKRDVCVAASCTSVVHSVSLFLIQKFLWLAGRRVGEWW